MQAGRKTCKVVLQSPTGSRDAVGERTTTWVDVATVWAAIAPLTAREMFAAAQAQAPATHRVRIDYSSAVAAIVAAWRVKFGVRIFIIDGVRNIDERNVELELLCTEGLRVE